MSYDKHMTYVPFMIPLDETEMSYDRHMTSMGGIHPSTPIPIRTTLVICLAYDHVGSIHRTGTYPQTTCAVICLAYDSIPHHPSNPTFTTKLIPGI